MKSINLMLSLIILAVLLVYPVESVFNFRRQPKKPKRAKKGWRKTKKDRWLRLDLPAGSSLRVGVTHRPSDCP